MNSVDKIFVYLPSYKISFPSVPPVRRKKNFHKEIKDSIERRSKTDNLLKRCTVIISRQR